MQYRMFYGILIALIAIYCAVPCVCWGQIPPQASAVGYMNNTFSSVFTMSTVDAGHTFQNGYQWYPAHFFGGTATDSASMQLGSGSTIVLSSDGTSAGNKNGQIASITPSSTSQSGIIGTAFGGGGYFEAVLKFSPTVVFSQWNLLGSAAGWPSWWSMAAEHLALMPASQFWYYYDPAMSDMNYGHFIESDFFEYDVANANNPLVYGGNMHDWFGDWTSTSGWSGVQVPYSNILMNVPTGTDFTQYHKYGYLWVPATTTTNGYAKYYFDGVQVGAQPVIWSQYQGQAPPPTTSTPWTFGIIDQEHLGLMLGSGVNMPMTVQSVNVWQASANQNIGSGTLYDTLYNFGKAAYSNMGTDHATPISFNGDTSRALRNSLSNGTLTYNLSNITSFTTRLFVFNNTSNMATFAVSPDDATWTTVTTTTPGTVSTTNGWAYRDISNAGAIPAGMNYLKITLSGSTGKSWDLEIGQVRIN